MFDQRYNCVSQDKHGKFFVLLSRISNENSSNNRAFNRPLKNVFEESDENKNRRKRSLCIIKSIMILFLTTC